jgi:phage portal protein BeeE
VELSYTVDGEPMPTVPRNRPTEVDGTQYRYTDSGRAYLLPIPLLVTPSAPWGLSPVQAARQTITGMADVERQASTLLQSGNYLGGRLETDLDIDPDTARRIRAQWVAERKTGQIPIIGAGVKYVTDTLSPADAQWLESRAYSAQQIAALYGVPNSFLGVSLMGGQSSLSYANAQDNLAAFRRNALSAFTKKLEIAVSTLLPNGTQAQFDWQEWEAPGYDADAPDNHGI